MRLSIKLFQIFLFFLNLLLCWSSASAQSTTWNSAFNPIPNADDNVTISGNVIEIPLGQVVEITSLVIDKGPGNTEGKLVVNGTLIIHGDLTMIDNNTAFEMGSKAIVIVDGNFTSANQITIQLDSYLIIRGNFTKSGSVGQGDLEIAADVNSPAHIYIFGETSGWGSNFTTCEDYYSTDGNVSSADCDYGTLPNFIENLGELPDSISGLLGCEASLTPSYYTNGKPNSNSPVPTGGSISLTANAGASYPVSIAYFSWEGPNAFYYSSSSTQNTTLTNAGISHSGYYTYTAMTTTGCFITDSTYVLVSDCGFSSGYYSRDNYTGNWKEESTWGASDNSMALPPPNNPNSSQPLTIKGYVTLNDNLSLTGSQQYVCDTLVVTGNLHMTSNSFVVAPGGVLIVLGDFTAGSGSLVNNEGGKIIFAGEFTKTYSYSFSGTGDTYVFDPDPVSEGFTPTGNENDLEANDPSLFNFYISLVGGVPPTANCEDLTIYLDASGLASIQPADVHDGALMTNLTYALSQSDFDCDDLGENTITLTATNSGGLSDDCTATVTVVDNLKPVVTCPPDSIASCIEAISQPATTVAGFVARGGTISDNCAVNISAVDVTDKKDAINPCEVVRTYTITDQAGNVQTCVRKFKITDATAPVIQDCPNDITDSADENCEKVISVDAPTNFTDGCGFGDVTVYHAYTIAGVLIEAAGGIDQVAFPKGTTIITWSFEDECGNMGTCEQAITIKDDTEPTASCPAGQELDAGNTCSVLLPDYTSLLIDLNDNCDLNPTVTQRPAVDTEVFANTEIWLLYADEDGNQDSCSFLVNLTNLAPIDISEMLYDGGQSGIGAIGSGQKPFITSTHPYEIDQNESTPEDYTYTWLVLDQSGTEVTPDISSPDSNPQNAVIAFSETHFVEADSYTIRVVKEQKTGNCSAVFELAVEVQQTNFNSGIQPLAPTCQDGGTGVPTVVFWDVDFTGGVEPYAFDFTISNGMEGCTGQVSNLFTNDLEPIEATENCNGAYTVAVTKESGMPAVQIAFTFISEAGVDKVFELTVDSATDQFSITKQTINTDERDDITLWGVPNTSDIETD